LQHSWDDGEGNCRGQDRCENELKRVASNAAHNVSGVAKMVTDSNRARICLPSRRWSRKGSIRSIMKTNILVAHCLLPAVLACRFRNHTRNAHSSSYSSHHGTAHSCLPTVRSMAAAPHQISRWQLPGETNANHKNGHYSNWRSANRYGVHKPVITGRGKHWIGVQAVGWAKPSLARSGGTSMGGKTGEKERGCVGRPV